MVDLETEVLIIGGGLTGATLMLALQQLGFDTLMVDATALSNKVKSNFDARSLALSPASIRILSKLGLWDILQKQATPINKIHVSDQHRFGMSRLKGINNQPLGQVLEMQYINLALFQLLPKERVIAPATLSTLDLQHKKALVMTEQGEMTIRAQLIVAADGSDSSVRRCCNLSSVTKEYRQQAIVANVGLVKPHNNWAFERFTEKGPLALLPMQDNRMSLVWAMSPTEASNILALDDRAFLRQLQQFFGYRLGRFNKIGIRFSYPLKQVLMKEHSQWPVVFVGNAAHTLHPVAGQGFNLGLRDVATLAQCLAKGGVNEKILTEYKSLRKHDQHVISQFTDGLIHLFSSSLPGVGIARSLGLMALDALPVFKDVLTCYASGFGGSVPDLACNIALPIREIK